MIQSANPKLIYPEEHYFKKEKIYSTPRYTTPSAPFPNFATTVTELVPGIPAKVPLAPGLASGIPFCAPLTETLSSVISPGMQVVANTSSWIEEGGTFWPLIATVQDGGCGAVGATKSVEEMMAGEGIGTGCGEGLERNRAAIRITKRMMPPMMSQGRRDRFAM